MSYYSEKLGGTRLRECYETAPPRVKQYLSAEIRFLLDRIQPGSAVLELGCGYGRVALELTKVAGRVVGIDTSTESLELARKLGRNDLKCGFLEMDALDLRFSTNEFDVVLCVQNGICAFGVDQRRLLREAVRVTRTGGRVFFSSYSERFWPHRLAWFQHQAKLGLVGEIDTSATGNGVIVCKDGFRAGTMSPEGFIDLCGQIGLVPTITEVDGSSVFCELVVTGDV